MHWERLCDRRGQRSDEGKQVTSMYASTQPVRMIPKLRKTMGHQSQSRSQPLPCCLITTLRFEHTTNPPAWSRNSDPRAPSANISQDVPPEHLAYGNPARVIRKLTDGPAESEHAPAKQISSAHLSPDSDAAATAKSDPTMTTSLAAPPCYHCSCPSPSPRLPRALSSHAEPLLLTVQALLLFAVIVLLLRTYT